METSESPEVACEQIHPILTVNDLEASIDFYTKKLGFILAFKWGAPATMAGLNLGGVQMFLEKGTPGAKGCSVYFVVSDANKLHTFQKARGVEIISPPEIKEWHFSEYTVRDFDGYYLIFGQRLKVG